MAVGVLGKKIIGVIPARYNSIRLPGKPLKDIFGKPMVYWVAKRVKASIIEEFYVATDDVRIFDACKKYSIPCLMTSPECSNGTERVAEVAEKIFADYYVNIQGDEPCIEVDAINKLVESVSDFNNINFLQAVSKLKDKKAIFNPSVVKVAISEKNEALYYSRLPIPFSRDKLNLNEDIHYRCLGLYLYSRSFLNKYLLMSPTHLENIESIEQLRILENRIIINTVEVKDYAVSIDTLDDLEKIRNSKQESFLE
jgi:3-deoxy-manno-octulosonate cytidylyltransferase (CMP-KDO synthetase)